MRHAPAYSADRFPLDFAASGLAALFAAAVVGPLTWWLARRYLQQIFPGHPEMRSAAIFAGAGDAVIVASLVFVLCFALRIFRTERRERRRSDEALRLELERLDQHKDRSGIGGEPPVPRP